MVSFMFRSLSIPPVLLLLAAVSFSTAARAQHGDEFRCAASPSESLLDQANRFILFDLTFQPAEATQIGYHGDARHPLDSQLDDLGPATRSAHRAFLARARQCFATVKANTAEDAADRALVRDSIESSIFQIDVLQSYRYSPQDYVEMIGSALFFPLTATQGSELERLTAVVARMEQIPRVVDQAQHNLKEADPVYIETAIDENSGNLAVIEQVGTMVAPGSPLRPRYDAAAKAALASLNGFSAWLKDDLSKRPHTVTWRTGPDVYAKIFAFALGPGTRETPDSVLTSARRDLARVRGEMYSVALPLHQQWFPGHSDHAELSGDALQNKIISEVIDHINLDHAAPGDLLKTVQDKAKEIRAFIVAKDLLTLSGRDNLHIVPTPEFMRGSFSVAGFHSAPPLDPTADAEYWVTPIDPHASADQAESKLREYNNWMLQYLTMHEALPGHYTQFEHANNLEPASRRIVRGALGSGTYAEGWGEYAVREMEDAGYANNDPRFVLMVQKIRLRVITNAILDISLQSRGMTDQEALDLMQQQAFQTRAEADGKLRRAKLTAGQLITYYVGYHQWIDLRAKEQTKLGEKFSLKAFNNAALDEGPLPIPVLEPLLDERLSKAIAH